AARILAAVRQKIHSSYCPNLRGQLSVAVSPGFSGEILVEVVQRRLEDIGSSQATAITRGKAGASLSLR
ncbi:hypothetical protein, partial [Bradyrhizobium japonicum]|uniref:hypothetical protein n=1 Tax=Bradyrhizobium japonicum TaxID=375 RepID=UPI001AECE2CC